MCPVVATCTCIIPDRLRCATKYSFVNLALAYPVYRLGFGFGNAPAIGRLIAIARTCLAAEETFAAQCLLTDNGF